LNGRRRNPRYHVSTPFEGVLQTLTSATIESRDGSCLMASCDAPLRTGLSLALDLFAGSGRRTLPVTVADSAPVIQSGLVRYRLRLAMAAPLDGMLADDGRLAPGGHGAPGTRGTRDAALTTGRGTERSGATGLSAVGRCEPACRAEPHVKSAGIEAEGLLVVDTPVRVLDISENGFLLEAVRQSAAGTAGLLQVAVDGRDYEGEIRIIRYTAIEGIADRHRLGIEFLCIRRIPHGSALRTAFFAMMRTG
jgi:hypothetical protein